MATKRTTQRRLSVHSSLKDYKGFGKMINGRIRKGFVELPGGQIISENAFENATNDDLFI